MRIKEQTSKDWHKQLFTPATWVKIPSTALTGPLSRRASAAARGSVQRINHTVFSSRRSSAEVRLRSTSVFLGKYSSSSSSSLFECCHANTIGWIASDGLLKQHTRPGWTLSPLALSCANDLAWARPLALSPLAKMCLGVGLTCDSTVTHKHTHTHRVTHAHYWRASWRLRWFVTSPSFPLISSLIFLHLSSIFISPPPSPC